MKTKIETMKSRESKMVKKYKEKSRLLKKSRHNQDLSDIKDALSNKQNMIKSLVQDFQEF